MLAVIIIVVFIVVVGRLTGNLMSAVGRGAKNLQDKSRVQAPITGIEFCEKCHSATAKTINGKCYFCKMEEENGNN